MSRFSLRRLHCLLGLLLATLVLTPGCSCLSADSCEAQARIVANELPGTTYAEALESCLEEQERYFWNAINQLSPNITQSRMVSGVAENPEISPIGRLGTGVPETIPEIHELVEDAGRNLYVGGSFSVAEDRLGNSTDVLNVAKWNAQANGGIGAWEALGGGLDGPVHALVIGPDGALYAGGAFQSSPGNSTLLSGIARWNSGTNVWEPVGQGVQEGTPTVQELAVDDASRLVVAGEFLEAVDASGTTTTVNGIARWDLDLESWEGIGPGFNFPSFRGLLAGTGDEVIVSGFSLFVVGAGNVYHVMRWDGTTWTPYDQGIDMDALEGANELAVDGEGTRYVRHYQYLGAGNETYRVVRRGPGDPSWTVTAEDPDLEFVSATPAATGATISGAFKQVNGLPANGIARWDGAGLFPVPTPGACSALQMIHAMPDPKALPVDLVLDGSPLVEDISFGGATPLLNFTPGELHDGSLLLGGTAALRWLRRSFTSAGSDTLFTMKDFVFEDRACAAASVGVLNPEAFAPNPDGRDIGATLATGEIPIGTPLQGGNTTFLMLHAVTDAPSIDVFIDGQLSVDDLLYGRFGPALSLTPSNHQIRLVRNDNGTTIGTYDVDMSTAGDERRTLTLTGFMDPASNNGGPAMTVHLIDEDGVSTPVPTASEPGIGEVARSIRLLGNYPNPFAASTSISYVLPRAERIRLTIYDLMGREVVVLIDETRPAGTHTITFSRDGLASGIYHYVLKGESTIHTKRMLYVR